MSTTEEAMACPAAGATNAMSAADLSRLIERAVRGLPREVFVRGDLTNASRGTRHLFAGLRDGRVIIRLFVHGDVLKRLPTLPSEGTTVVVRAAPVWYRARGEMQLFVRDLWIADARRARRVAVRRLHLELEEKGLLRANRCLALPRLPAAIAVVGGQASAAVLDVVDAVHRRSPRTAIHFRPTRLQGPGAEREIAEAIRAAVGSGAEVVAVVRGGGGVDDFAPFDGRHVCEAIAASPVPVVTALGHEQDRTLADLAAHSSASTPTDAARFLVADVVDVKGDVTALRRRLYLGVRAAQNRIVETSQRRRQRLTSAVTALTAQARLRLGAADVRSQLPRLGNEINLHRRTTVRLGERFMRAVNEKLATDRRALQQHNLALTRCLVEAVRREKERFAGLHARLTLAEPEAVVSRGFVIARIAGQPVTSAWEARDLGVIDLQFGDGNVRVRVEHSTNEGGEG